MVRTAIAAAIALAIRPLATACFAREPARVGTVRGDEPPTIHG